MMIVIKYAHICTTDLPIMHHMRAAALLGLGKDKG